MLAVRTSAVCPYCLISGCIAVEAGFWSWYAIVVASGLVSRGVVLATGDSTTTLSAQGSKRKSSFSSRVWLLLFLLSSVDQGLNMLGKMAKDATGRLIYINKYSYTFGWKQPML